MTTLLLSLLGLAHFAGPAPARAQAARCLTPPASALIVPTAWHQ